MLDTERRKDANTAGYPADLLGNTKFEVGATHEICFFFYCSLLLPAFIGSHQNARYTSALVLSIRLKYIDDSPQFFT